MKSNLPKVEDAVAVGLIQLVGHRVCDAENHLTTLIEKSWDESCPLPKCVPSLLTPSHNQIRILARIVLTSCGVNPLECSNAVLCRIAVSITNAVCREESNLDRLTPAVALRSVGVTNRVNLIATIRLCLDNRNRFIVQVYRNLIGIAAVVFDQEVDRFSGRHFSVHFITH